MSNVFMVAITVCGLTPIEPSPRLMSRISVYDPVLGGINCDDNCATVAMGEWYTDMYKVSGACPPELYGATLYLPDLDKEFHCIDTGPAVVAVHYPGQLVSWLDVMWPLTEEDPPDYLGLWFEYEVAEWGGAWTWYQEIVAQHGE